MNNVIFDWKIQEIERTANECKGRLHELDSLRGDMGRLEQSLREARSEVEGLRNELQDNREKLNALELDFEYYKSQNSPPHD